LNDEQNHRGMKGAPTSQGSNRGSHDRKFIVLADNPILTNFLNTTQTTMMKLSGEIRLNRNSGYSRTIRQIGNVAERWCFYAIKAGARAKTTGEESAAGCCVSLSRFGTFDIT